jgi:predicted RNase H-like HicB family nuclease
MTMVLLSLMSGAIPSCHAWGQTPDEARAELVNVFEMIEE